MSNKELFHEKQRFRQWWLWLLLIAFPVYSVYAGWQQYVATEDVWEVLLINGGELLIVGLIILLFLLIHLETIIREDGVYVRLYPFHLKFKHFRWQELREVYVRKYSPLGEFGGWGLRWGLFGSGKAYNISGNMGLQLIFKSGKKVLIGTQKPEELDATILNRMGIENKNTDYNY